MSDSSTECIYGNCEIYDLLKENCKCCENCQCECDCCQGHNND